MGDPRRSKNTWSKPAHPWQKSRIDQEKILTRTYSLGNKKEIWKMTSLLKKIKDQAKMLAAGTGKQNQIETTQLLNRTIKLGIIKHGQGLDEILGVPVEAVMDRRLQTVVFKKGLARTMKQARQFIVHQHILIGSTKMTAPGYLVKVSEESAISFVPNSKLASPDHPERAKEVPAHAAAPVTAATGEESEKKEHKESKSEHKEHKAPAKDAKDKKPRTDAKKPAKK